MKSLHRFALSALMVGTFAHTMESHGCPKSGWPTVKTVNGDAASSTETLERKFGIKIKLSSPEMKCGRDPLYDIRDVDGTLLIRIPVPTDSSGPKADHLVARVRHLMKTPKGELRAISRAEAQYAKDVNQLEDEYGVRFSAPDTRDAVDRQYAVTASTEECYTVEPAVAGDSSTLWYHSDVDVVGTDIRVDTIEYSPRRTRYKAGEIYREGQLRARLIKSPTLMSKLASRAKGNAELCTREMARRADWRSLADKFSALAGPGTPLPGSKDAETAN